MCTAITYKTKDNYFGRNLDLEYSYHEEVTILPRNYPLPYRTKKIQNAHIAIIGVATVANGYPLYYDATNEFGLSMAGLNFPGNAVYHPICKDKDNIAPFELIPWILGQCKTVLEAKSHLSTINLVDINFSDELPLTPLHWIISDEQSAITVEPLKDGLKIYDNTVGVLTNNPPFDYHMYNLSNYLNLTSKLPVNRFTDKIDLKPYSNGMGAIGLPGDLSSSSRFIKAVFTKLNSVCDDEEAESVGQFFHILRSVEQQQGCVNINGKYEKTVYSSCCNTTKGIYYYTTYENSQITAVTMHQADLNSAELVHFPLRREQQIYYEN